MYDIALRSWKDRLVNPLAGYVPSSIHPNHITAISFACGLLCCLFASLDTRSLSLLAWFLNRFLDCLDGAVARHRNIATPLGGFLDLLADFITYSLLPITIATSQQDANWSWIALLEASFHINNFILFYSAAVAAEKKDDELTSVTMTPALIEGFESGVLFTLMLAFPQWINTLSLGMVLAVGVGIVQRTWAVCEVLERKHGQKSIRKAEL